MIVYATVNQLRERLGLPEGDSATDARLLGALRQATAQIARYTARRFAPVIQTRRYDYQTPYRLRLDIDLLEVLEVTNGDGSAVPLDAVQLVPTGDGPRSAILLAFGSGALFTYDTYREQALSVRGIWGFHDEWAQAWWPSGDSLQIGIDDADASLSVGDVDGPDARHGTPRFQAGQLLRMGDEYLHVAAVDAEADTLSVIRGVRGTEAVSHPGGTPLEIYSPPQDVQALCLRWAAWISQQTDPAIGAGAEWLYPPDLPPDVQRLAARLQRIRVA